MQGTLQEIDIRTLLKLAATSQQTGYLLIKAKDKQWIICFANSQITYAADYHNEVRRLFDYLHRYRGDLSDSLETMNLHSGQIYSELTTSAYQYLVWLVQSHHLTISQVQQILQLAIKETLWEVLALSRGEFQLHWSKPLTPTLGSWEIYPLLLEITQQIQEWYQIYPRFSSTTQCLIIVAPNELQNEMGKGYYNLALIANGNNSISRIARYLHRDVVAIAKSIYPYVKKGWIKLLPSANRNDKSGKDSNTALNHNITTLTKDYVYI